jgi:hypothetical protein
MPGENQTMTCAREERFISRDEMMRKLVVVIKNAKKEWHSQTKDPSAELFGSYYF